MAETVDAPCSGGDGVKHDLVREKGGLGEESWIQPTCSCGWVGRKEYAYNDWQMTNVSEQEREHIRKANIGENR